MFIEILKSKLHRGTVTKSTLDYPGSIGIDPVLMEAAGIVTYEKVLVADLNNGHRLETYVVPAERGSGDIEILGAAAQLMHVGDRIIILSFAYCTADEAAQVVPKIIVLGENNTILTPSSAEV